MRKKIKWMCLIFWIIFIFLMSNQNGGTSSNTSFLFVKMVVEAFPRLSNQIEIISFLIRKLAHVLEYFILGIFVFLVVEEYSIQKTILISVLICICLSCMDEIHQIFISGRNGTIFDIIIDMVGFLFSILIMNRINLKKKT